MTANIMTSTKMGVSAAEAYATDAETICGGSRYRRTWVRSALGAKVVFRLNTLTGKNLFSAERGLQRYNAKLNEAVGCEPKRPCGFDGRVRLDSILEVDMLKCNKRKNN